MKKLRYFALLLLIAIPFAVQAVTIDFLRDETTKKQSVKTMILFGNEWISLSDFISTFGENIRYDKETARLSARLKGNDCIFYGGSSFYQVNKTLFHLMMTVEIAGTELFLPRDEWIVLLREHFFPELEFLPAQNLYILEPAGYNIQDISIRSFKNGSIIRIQTAEIFKKEHCKLWEGNNGWLYFSIYGASIDTVAFAKTYDKGVLKQVVPMQLGASVQLSFKLRQSVKGFDFYIEENPRSIVISLRLPISSDTRNQLLDSRSKWLIDTIVLDAGHGGKDAGAVAPDGTQEKMITLDIVKRLGKLLEKNLDVKVVYTRTTDTFIPLSERPKIANQAEGKLFLSVHCNSTTNKYVSGSETYLLSLDKSDQAVEVAELENKAIQFEENQAYYEKLTSEQHIIATLAHSQYMKESGDLASLIEKKYIRTLHRGNENLSRGTKQAGFYVLIGASMPNVLTEVGFLSNRTDLKNLKSSAYRQNVAQSLFEAIKEFKMKSEEEIKQ